MDMYHFLDTTLNLLFTLLSIVLCHFVVFAIIGLFKRKTYKKATEQLKYGVIIPARNEEAVVTNLIESIKKCDYPQDKLHIFVIAHNCTDRTAAVSRAAGATVYEYNNPEECTMGYAFRYLFKQIKKDYGIEHYDGFFLFNADNVLDKRFFEKMNDAFLACERKCVITSFRNSKNFGTNVMSAMYGLYFAFGCRMESRGRTVLGCSTRVQGTGYLINSDIVRDEWKYVTLTEDWEFTVDQILGGTPIRYCDEAMFYDEQPTDFRIMWRQRLRWAKGHLLVCTTRFKDILKGLFTPKKKGGCKTKFSLYDIGSNIFPSLIITCVLTVLQQLLYLCSPLLGQDIIAVYAVKLPGMIGGFLSSYVMLLLAAITLYIVERKRIPKISLPIKIGSCLLMPFFYMISFLLAFGALFTKNVGWKPIPHEDTTTFEHLNKAEEAKTI